MATATNKQDLRLVSENQIATGLPKPQSAVTASNKQFYLLVGVSALVILASAATLAALYAPQHMPDAVSKIVEGLSTTAFYGITAGAGVTGALGVTGVGYAFYNNKYAKGQGGAVINSSSENDGLSNSTTIDMV